MKTVTITEKEYNKLKKEAEIDLELVERVKRSLENVKQGKVKVWKKEELQ